MILCLDDLDRGKSNGGRIWLVVGEICFPEYGWYDLPGILLEKWIPDLESFANEHTNLCTLRFMDGPYSVRLERDQGVVRASCIDRGREVLEQRIDFPLFWESVERRLRYYERVKYLGFEE